MTRRASGAKKTTPPASTLEPLTIQEWNEVIRDMLDVQHSIQKRLAIIWLETKNGTLWPHKVTRE